MSFTIRSFNPALLAAIASEAGNIEGELAVARAIQERENQLASIARSGAYRRPQEATPAPAPYVMGRPLGSDNPPIRTPSNEQRREAARGVGFNGVIGGFPVRTARQPQDPIITPARLSAPSPAPSQPAQSYARPIGLELAAIQPSRTLERITSTQSRRRGSGSQSRDAAAVVAGSMRADEIARLIQPALGGRPDSFLGGEEGFRPEEITLASNVVRAFDDLPFDQSHDGTSLYSLSELQRRHDELASTGVPPQFLGGMKRGIEHRAAAARSAIQAALAADDLVTSRTAAKIAAGVMDPTEVEAERVQALTEVAAQAGMTPEQLIDAFEYLAARGVPVKPPRSDFVRSTDASGRENVTFFNRR